MNLHDLADVLRDALEGRVEQDWPLARLTTYRLGGPAALYVEPAGRKDIGRLAGALRAAGATLADVPIVTLGRGSNLVISDEGWPGLVLRLGEAFSSLTAGSQEHNVVAGGATSLPQLANWAARRRLAGMEFLVAIPGSVGGAVRMNAGAHGREIGDCLTSVQALDLDLLEVHDRPAASLDLRYRRSNLGERDVVLAATFALASDEEAAIRARMEAYRRHRAATQPGAAQNAGSVFKNPPGDSAGRLVEAAGLKGFRVGGATVSKLHANFFVAEAGARAQDVFDLVQAVRARVKSAFGIDLEPEVRFVGEFRHLETRANQNVES